MAEWQTVDTPFKWAMSECIVRTSTHLDGSIELGLLEIVDGKPELRFQAREAISLNLASKIMTQLWAADLNGRIAGRAENQRRLRECLGLEEARQLN